MNIHWIQHVPFEGLGNIKEWIENHHHTLSCTKQYSGESLPDIHDIDMLIIMGGSMGVYDVDEYPWIKTETQFIKECVELNKPVLGICLGSQFIASAMDAKVYPGPVKEIGWFPVQIFNKELFPFEEDHPVIFHWHGDTFDLPNNAELLASTPEVKHQAFRFGDKTIAIQFHLEQTEETVAGMLTHFADDLLENGAKIQSKEEIESQKHYFETNKKIMFHILDFLAK